MEASDLQRIQAANLKNIVLKLTKGQTLNSQERAALEEAASGNLQGKPQTDKPPASPLTRKMRPQKLAFCDLIVQGGYTQAECYKSAYGKPNCNPQQAAERASRMMAEPAVKARIAELRSRVEQKLLVSLNDRLDLLAQAMKLPTRTPAERNALARLIEVYNKTAGHPDNQTVTLRTEPGQPVEVVNRELSRAEKMEAIKQRRAAREKDEAALLHAGQGAA